jgi:hypothetical protein
LYETLIFWGFHFYSPDKFILETSTKANNDASKVINVQLKSSTELAIFYMIETSKVLCMRKTLMNQSIAKVTTVIGLTLMIAGLVHGTFEILQGNNPVNGLVIQAIGDAHQQWFYGTEEAFTLLPTFLSAGILSNIVAIALGVWSWRFISHKHGASIFLAMSILLFLVGGGIAQLVFFLPTWAVATRINKPINKWKKLPESLLQTLSPLWPVLAAFAFISFMLGLHISITGKLPIGSSTDPEVILNICWTFIFGGGWIFFLLSYLSAFSADALTTKESS